MVGIVFLILITVVAIFLAIAAEKRWIKLPEDQNVTQLIAVVGVPVLIAILFVVVLFPLKIYSLIAEEGFGYLLWNIGLVVAIAMFGLGIGFFYFRFVRKRNASTVQVLNLTKISSDDEKSRV